MDSILVIGDPHFKLTNRLQMDVVVDECVRVARERKPTFIVCLGDVLDRFSTIREEPLNQALGFFHRLLEHADLFVLVGNHDRPNNATFCTAEHPFNACKHWAGGHRLHIIDTPRVFIMPSCRTYTFVPYVPNGRFAEALSLPSAKGWENSEFIFAHQDFKGAVYNGLASATGDDWNDELPMVISGHIHDYQELPGVIYPGSPIQHAASESKDKTLFWLEVSDEATEAVRVPISVPVYHTEVLAAAAVPTAVLPSLPTRSVVKVLIEGTYQELQGLGKWDKVRTWRSQGIVVQPKLVVPKGTAMAVQGTIPSFRDLMAEEVRGTPLQTLWTDVLAAF
jgi:Calcineurin-like phosphoesterase